MILNKSSSCHRFQTARAPRSAWRYVATSRASLQRAQQLPAQLLPSSSNRYSCPTVSDTITAPIRMFTSNSGSCGCSRPWRKQVLWYNLEAYLLLCKPLVQQPCTGITSSVAGLGLIWWPFLLTPAQFHILLIWADSKLEMAHLQFNISSIALCLSGFSYMLSSPSGFASVILKLCESLRGLSTFTVQSREPWGAWSGKAAKMFFVFLHLGKFRALRAAVCLLHSWHMWCWCD